MFKKKVENFECENCGHSVVGNGYTNHCPKCLWSKHVDIDPGDRAAKCGGLMKPIKIEKDGEEDTLVHECVACGYSKRNKVATGDDYDRIVEVARIAAANKPL